jgi:hypothetical protein
MGTTQSKTDHIPEQRPDQGMRQIDFPLGQKIPLGGPFFIKGELNNEIYRFQLYHLDNTGVWTEFFSFETEHQLKNDFKVEYNGSFVKFVFETVSFEKGLKRVIKYSFDFSKSFHSEKDSNKTLKSFPHCLPNDEKIIFLEKKYWYYVNSNKTYHEFMIVESVDDTSSGFMSVFKNGDCVIQTIKVESKNLPFVMGDGEGNHFIVSNDKGFHPIQIILECDIQGITHLVGKYWYLVKLVNWSYVFYIVELSDETAREFKSITRSIDNVVEKIFVKSSNVPYVIEDKNKNFFITSNDDEFVPVPIPIQLQTLPQLSSQESSQ